MVWTRRIILSLLIYKLEGHLQQEINDFLLISYMKDLLSLIIHLAAELKKCLLHTETTEPRIEQCVNIVENDLIQGCLGLVLILSLVMEELLFLYQ
jgi:hypothetical protein